ncbi:MAG TPA: DNA/RNA non-specific endonuclease [Gemmatimonadaceae bacterium]|jgi:hypothetical protein
MPGPVNLSAGCHADGSCFVYHDLTSRQTLMVGLLAARPQGFARAPITPAPWCGFLTPNTPFDKGHIMALELGGPDVTENIVPQYQHWQETGAWKQMENTVKQAAATLAGPARMIMVVEIAYGRPNLPTYATSSVNFCAGQRLTAWEDNKIPTRFRIWTLNTTIAPGIALAALLAANNPPAEATLLAQLPAAPSYDLVMNAMPDEDRHHQRRQMISETVKRAYVTYEHDHGAAMTSFFNQPLAGSKKRTRGSLGAAVAAGMVPVPAAKLTRAQWVNANWQAVRPTIPTTDMTVVEQNFNQHDITSSILSMFGV